MRAKPRLDPLTQSPAADGPERTPRTAILTALRSLDPLTLSELTMHCRDRGHNLPAPARRALRGTELLSASGDVSEIVREIVLAHVQGHGLTMRILGASSAAPTPAAKLEPWTERVRELVLQGQRRAAAEALSREAAQLASSGSVFDIREMAVWTAAAASLSDPNGRVTPELQALIGEVERRHAGAFSESAASRFQDFVATAGGKLAGRIKMPSNQTPHWLKGPSPLANFQSRPTLPTEADVVIVGAGLTGASSAYHLSRLAQKKGLKVVVIDAGDPATGATGRNGGNFELIPENFYGGYGTYDGLEGERLKFLKASYPDLPEAALRTQAARTARAIIDLSLKNAARMAKTIEREKIDCDYSPAGWLRTALNEREAQAFEREAALANPLGGQIEILEPEEIRSRFGFPSDQRGRLVKSNGNYHPFKLVTGEMIRAIERGVELYTRTPVARIESKGETDQRVVTARGTIKAKRVIVATNAFTSKIFPELSDIRYFRSQLSAFNHVEDKLAGITVTAKDGDIYANFPKGERYIDEEGRARGTLIVGGGKDTEGKEPSRALPSPRVFELSRGEVETHFEGTEQQPPTRAWAGPMAFVEGKHGMRLPVLGPLGQGPRSGVFIAVWCNGYGGTGCHQVGAGAAAWALTGRVPKDMPQDVFGPQRLFTDAPQFPVE